jgi:hypothetical protein
VRCPFAEWIPSPYFTPGRGGLTVQTRLEHTTVGTMAATIKIFRSSSRRVSAHFVIGLDGRIVQCVDTDDTAWHAGDWATNLRSIGIEHVDDGAYWDALRTDAEYAASARVQAWVGAAYGLEASVATMQPHRLFTATACPDALDVPRIIRETGGDMGISGDQAKDIWREMIASAEGHGLLVAAIGAPDSYGPLLEAELGWREARTVVETLLQVRDDCLKPRVLAAHRARLAQAKRELAGARRTLAKARTAHWHRVGAATEGAKKRPTPAQVLAGHGRG